MASGYSRTIDFTGLAGVPLAIELPMPPRGVLERVVFTQISGDSITANCYIYDRRGACIAAGDLNVINSGVVTGIYETTTGIGGFLAIVTDEAHNLVVGSVIEIKNSTEESYNSLQTVTIVYDATTVVTDKVYLGDDTNSLLLWQTMPFEATTRPVTHLMNYFVSNGEGGGPGGAYVSFGIDQAYENKDNQSQTMRSRYSALWLEVLTTANDPAVEQPFRCQIAYTCRADTVV